jgi:DNA polymerase-3 subunit delta'
MTTPCRYTFADLPYQRELAAALARAVARRRLAHAYLFEGPRGVGKEDVAYALGAAVMCPGRPGEGCGVCNTCRRVFADLHPDFRRHEAEGAHFELERVREVVAEAGRPPSEAPYKFALVVEPEKMTYRSDAPANAFLKTLEEPPGRTIFILLAHDARLLLPTIVSRCVNVHFRGLRADEITAALVARYGLTPEAAARASRRAGGTLEGARAAADEDYRHRLEDAARRWEEAAAGGVAGAFAAAGAVAGRDDALALVAALATVVRELAAVAAGAPELVQFPELAARYDALLAGGRLKPPEALAAEVARAGAALHDNANVGLTLAELFLRARTA